MSREKSEDASLVALRHKECTIGGNPDGRRRSREELPHPNTQNDTLFSGHGSSILGDMVPPLKVLFCEQNQCFIKNELIQRYLPMD